jgi:hypothetical protein
MGAEVCNHGNKQINKAQIHLDIIEYLDLDPDPAAADHRAGHGTAQAPPARAVGLRFV